MRRILLAGGICAAFLTGGAFAETLPVPATDYSVRGTVAGGVSVHYRHSNGKMRMEMKSADMPQPMVGYFDLQTQKGIMVMNLPGMPPMALETGMDEEGAPAIAQGKGRRIGSDRVAGEPCDEWQVESEMPGEKATDAVVCITPDGITLRMIGDLEGKRQTILEITEVSRSPQDPKLLVPPAGLKPMRLPGGTAPPRK